MSLFATIKGISKYTNLLMTIRSVGERWHFNVLNTNKKVQNSDFVRFRELQTRMSHFATIKDILKYTNLHMTIPNLGERWHFEALTKINKVQIPISWSFGNFCFSHWSIVEHFKQDWVTMLQLKISRNILICSGWFEVWVKDEILMY